MARRSQNTFTHRLFKVKKRTSIGNSSRSRPKNKNKRAQYKNIVGKENKMRATHDERKIKNRVALVHQRLFML